ncbi:phosphatase PAP2 family protein [Streptomyces sp. NPDC093225]|uniref:phosphatase PAP2 family protein n=1 Tax=Streptomyces sp. NPDC093225 TaxID=3366034 RepID=UPI0038188227
MRAFSPRHRSVRLALRVALPAVVLCLTTWQVLVSGALLEPDEGLSRKLVRALPDTVTEPLADLGNGQVAVPVLALAMTYAGWHARRAGARRWWLPPLAAGLAMAAVPAVVAPLKEWTARPGPLEPWAAGYFPSGHTATAAVAYAGAALLVRPYVRRDGRGSRWPMAAALTLAGATAVGLVLRGWHWPLDVLASGCLSVLLLGPVALASARVVRGASHRPGESGRTRQPK